jgi:acyl-[acyl-carrier-protein]-phospholipid O-acyltransferase/long-chain-fatty-acid--[acyl-carrier-protein] ligase
MKFSLERFRKLKEQSFGWINATQFFGALNDNVFKAFVQMFIIAKLVNVKSAVPLSIATIMFSLPFLLFTAYAGFLADRFSKKIVVVALKYAELAIMVLGIVAFLVGSPIMLYILLFLMSTQSALFSPTKYSIVPEIVEHSKLARANSVLVTFSFLAIILGSAMAPVVAKISTFFLPSTEQLGENYAYAIAQILCLLIAVAGILTSHRVLTMRPANPEMRPDWLFPRKMLQTWRWVRQDRELRLSFMGNLLFSASAAFLQINFVSYGVEHMGLDEKLSTLMFVFAALGIASGAIVAGRLSQRNIEFGTMPGGAALMTAATYIIWIMPAHPYNSVWPFIMLPILIFLCGTGCGLFIVPLDTFMQLRLPAEKRGEGLALSSFMSWSGVLIAGCTLYLLHKIKAGPAAGFMIMTIPTAILAFVSFFALKDFAFRFFVNSIVRLIYKVRVIGVDNVPVEGPAVLVANHASYMDSLLICACTRRRVRFLMSREIYDRWRFLQRAFDLYGVITISEDSSPYQIASALRYARKALDDGYLLCVFAEGGITRTGTTRAFKRGYERIVKGTNIPIIPVYLGGSWGTIYHYYKGQLIRRWFKMSLRRYRVTVLFGEMLPTETNAFDVRQAVLELSCDYFNARKNEHMSLGTTMVKRLRASWVDELANDTLGMNLTCGKALIASTALANSLNQRVENEEHIGILLPASCAALIANLSLALMGRSAVNLNFTTSKDAFLSSVEQCNLKTIITSRSFIERFPDLGLDESKLVFIEEILRGLTLGTKIRSFLLARFAPFKHIADAKPTDADTTAMVLFSSGSTGEPKGVMLSQHNVLSMAESLHMMFATSPKDRICGTLPLFHSFGIMGTVWYPVLGHIKISYHTNPLEADKVIEIVRENKATMIFGTPTFLQLYLRRATKEDFKTVHFILAGAEKLKESLIVAYEEKFGIRPYEAYGATELSPGIAVSIPHGTGGGIVQEGWRKGRTGIPCPGIAMKILDPDTGEPKEPGESGLLYLKGPNVMLGYLGRPDLTAEVFKDGWYCTGDIAFMDEDGFLGLTDRLSRFSKIGGEMVPHIAVEEALLDASGLSGPVLAVSSVEDERRGEKLVVLFTEECKDPRSLYEALEKTNLPNLWKPSLNDYHQVDTIPLLGTGKVDLGELKKLAAEFYTPQRNKQSFLTNQLS